MEAKEERHGHEAETCRKPPPEPLGSPAETEGQREGQRKRENPLAEQHE